MNSDRQLQLTQIPPRVTSKLALLEAEVLRGRREHHAFGCFSIEISLIFRTQKAAQERIQNKCRLWKLEATVLPVAWVLAAVVKVASLVDGYLASQGGSEEGTSKLHRIIDSLAPGLAHFVGVDEILHEVLLKDEFEQLHCAEDCVGGHCRGEWC